MVSRNRYYDYEYETVYENQWRETEYNYGNHFDMNFFTAPYDGLYRFAVMMRVYDSSNTIYMKVSIITIKTVNTARDLEAYAYRPILHGLYINNRYSREILLKFLKDE